jgi:hypothetical protein
VDNPPIRISLNSDAYYQRGDRARVRVRTERDGYVIVLRADVDGRVRVLFPLDPSDDDFVRGGKDYTLRGRGDRETFLVDDGSGDGTILAAFSMEPFHYDQFVRGNHWDYRVLASDGMQDDPEAGLLDLVTAMADSAHFDYDVVTYTVAGRLAYRANYGGAPCFGCGYGYGPSFRIGLAFGTPYYRYGLAYCDPWTDPFFCDPFFYSSFYDPFYYHNASYYRPYGYGYGYCYGDPFCFGFGRRGRVAYGSPRSFGGFVFKRSTPPPPLVLPRRRDPLATGVATPRSRVNGASRDWGSTRTTPPPSRTAQPRRRSPPPSARPAPSRGRNSSPPQRPRSTPPPRAREHHGASALDSWRQSRPTLRERGSSANRGRSGWAPAQRAPAFSRPQSRGWQAPRFGSGFSTPSLRGSFGGGIRQAAPRVSRPAPRRR